MSDSKKELLAGRVALVTGGGQGIGEACGRILAEYGAKVILADLNEKTAQAVADSLKAQGSEAAAIEHMDSLLTSEGWRELTCVKDSKYTYLPKELFHFKPNSRWADAYSMLVELLYPDLIVE